MAGSVTSRAVPNAQSARLVTRVVSGPSLNDDTLEEIWAFYRRFVDRSKAPFLDGVRRTEKVVLGREGHGGPLRAFVAVSMLDLRHGGATYGVMHGAWAAIDPAFRGGHLLHWVGLATFLNYKSRHPLRRTYVAIMASTYKSYLLMARNLAEFWPNRHAPTPAREADLLDTTMRRIASADWDREAGVVRRYGQLRYREGVVADEGDQGDPDVVFYAARNARQPEGDSLACLAPLSFKNWSFVASRAVRRTGQRLARLGRSRPNR